MAIFTLKHKPITKSGFMSDNVTVKLKGDKSHLDRELEKSESNVKNYAGAIKGLLIGIGSAFAIKKLADFSGGMISLYNTQIAAETKLESVVRATGGAAGYSSDQMKRMASELQNITGIGDEVILESQAIIATFKNIKGDQFRDATLAAADMATILGTDLKGASTQLAKALNDPIKGMGALAEAGVTFTAEQQKMITSMIMANDVVGAQQVLLDELASQFGGAAADQVATFAGQTTSMWNRIGDLGEAIGGMLTPVISALLPVLDEAVTFVENMTGALGESTEGVGEWAKGWGEAFVDAFKWSVKVATDSFSFLEATWVNFSKLIERETYSWILTMVSAFEELKHLFTEVGPAYIEWFFDNWQNILVDYANFQLTVYSNMFKNIGEFFEGVWAYLSGSKGGFEFVALTDGFEATMQKLPEIAARQQSASEAILKDSIKSLDREIGDSYDNIFKKNRDFIDKMFEKKVPVEVGEADLTDQEYNVTKIEEKTEKAKDNSKAMADAMNEAFSNKGGAVTGLTSLANDLQVAAMKASSITVSSKGFARGGGGIGQDEGGNAVGNAAQPGGKSDVVTVLEQILDYYPQLLMALKTAGGLV